MAARAARAATPAATEGDPLGSPQWPGLRREYTQDAPLRFTDAVQVRTPAFADDALNVPLQIDARALQAVGGGITRMVVIADRNPIREVLAFEPLQALPLLAFRIRLEQASPVRCLVRTHDGQWHVGGAMVQAAGGGCTVPGVTRADGSWNKTLNQVHARFFGNLADGTRRLRVQIMHPMDTGLVAGVPALYIEQLELQGYRVISGLLEIYRPLLSLSLSDFTELVEKERVKRFPIETRLFHKLSTRHRLAYVEAVSKLPSDSPEFPLWEYYYRCRLLQDYISGMTDLYAWDEYRRLMAVEQ